MSQVSVVDVLHEDASTWAVVECHEGRVSVGDSFVVARRPDGAVARLSLRVEEIALPTGPATQVDAPSSARLRLSGAEVALLEPGVWLQSWPRLGGYGAPADPDAAFGAQFAMATAGPLPPSALLAEGIPALDVQEPAHLNRWSTAFRILLCIPWVILMMLWTIVMYPVMFIGWCCALVIGRLPRWVASIATDYACFAVRLEAYAMLLSDRFPPFSGAGAAYPIRPLLPPPGTLNRWSVLVRVILALPAYVLFELLFYGWTIASFVIWLIVLAMGRYPRALFWASTAILRFYLRVVAYVLMLTSRYPQRLFRDAMPLAPVDGTPQPVPPAVPAQPVPPAPLPPVPPAPLPPQPVQPGPVKTYVDRLLVLFIVLGALGYTTIVWVDASRATERAADHQAAQQVNAAYVTLGTSFDQIESQSQYCQFAGNPQVCARRNIEAMATAVDGFETTLSGISVPSDASDEEDALHAAAESFRVTMDQFAHVPDLAASSSRFAQVMVRRGRALDNTYVSLMGALGVDVK